MVVDSSVSPAARCRPLRRPGRGRPERRAGRVPSHPVAGIPAPRRCTPPAMAATAASAPTGIERRFRFGERGTTLRTEVLGGVSTFLTMSYILFVNPAILSAAKVPAAGVAVRTALLPGGPTGRTGLAANIPVPLAPGPR